MKPTWTATAAALVLGLIAGGFAGLSFDASTTTVSHSAPTGPAPMSSASLIEHFGAQSARDWAGDYLVASTDPAFSCRLLADLDAHTVPGSRAATLLAAKKRDVSCSGGCVPFGAVYEKSCTGSWRSSQPAVDSVITMNEGMVDHTRAFLAVTRTTLRSRSAPLRVSMSCVVTFVVTGPTLSNPSGLSVSDFVERPV